MTQTHATRRQRQGFTLIELLVVIAIMAVLMGMLIVAVMPIFGTGEAVKARKELGQMTTAIASFERDLKVNKLPSRLLLKEDGNYGSGILAQDAALARDSVLFLKSIFPGIVMKNGIDWNGNGVIDPGYVILDGSQCLVFLLGGINNKGFSTNPQNPADLARADRIGPFYQFEQTRLVPDPANSSSAFLVYNDPWEHPYAYFSNYGKETNGYNRYGTSDCAGLGVAPYISSIDVNNVPTYYNSSSFQIISSGKDGLFGPGGLWGPNNPATGAGQDDMSNFSSAKLGSP